MAKQRKGGSRNLAQNSSSGVEKQREAAEKAAKSAALQSQILALNTKLASVNSQINSLAAERSKLIAYLSNWATRKALYDCNNNLTEVVITNVFEGECADKIKTDLDACILDMTQTQNGVGGLNGSVGNQITRLNEYVTCINSKLATLRYELNTL